jgi:hypothetical protein
VGQAGWRAVLVAAFALLAAPTSSAAPLAGEPWLGVRWLDPERALPFDEGMLAADVRSLLGLAGVGLEWTVAQPEDVDTGSELRVVLLSGERAGASDVMGSVRRGSPSRTAWISLRSVERNLGLHRHRSSPPTPGAQRTLSRALARVIAHELVHLLAPDLPHARGGLMAPRLGRRFLTAPRVALSPAVTAVLRAAADGSPVQRVASVDP